MLKAKQDALQKAGWRVGDADEFLGITPEEAAYADIKLRLGESLGSRRQQMKLTHAQFAKLISVSTSQVSRMEAGDPSVSIDLLIQSLLALGASSKDLGRTIAS